MTLSEYQRRAQNTDKQKSRDDREALVIPLLGLAGETGTLLSGYKKWLRDGDAHRLFQQKVVEDLGDILWYLANVAERFGVTLDEVATENLAKVEERFSSTETMAKRLYFDDDCLPNEQLPRLFRVTFVEERIGRQTLLRVKRGDAQVGDVLTDNAFEADGYRFHDAFHFAYATMLGWSPVTRYILKCKRKSKADVDIVEDGGRARVFEEGIAALVFQRAREHDFYRDVETVDYDILKTIKGLVSRQEVRVRTAQEWERAILEGYRIWRLLNENSGGTVTYDLENRRTIFEAAAATVSQ